MQIKPSFLPNLAVSRPVTIMVTLLAIVVVGGIAYLQIPVELLPSGLKPNFLGVWISYNNANPQEVEEQIARPVEEQVRTISGVKKVATHSNSNGCWTWLEFSGGTDMDVAYDQLRDRMERARAQLPEDFDRYHLRRFGRNDAPIIFLSVAFPPGEDDPYWAAEQLIKRPIERLDGVGNVEIWGADKKSIQILIDQDKVKAHNLDMFQVIQELRQDNFALSSGWVYEGDKKFTVRSLARFQGLEDIARLPVNRLGLTIGDVAEVKYDSQKRTWRQRINRKSGLLIGIFKESLANSVALSHELERVLEDEIFAHPRLQGAEVNTLFVQGSYIESAINNLKDTAIWGGIFAILLLLFFLRNVRMTIIMMFAIPLSILISLMVIYFIGWTINVITMMGLMISIGMVVDNGIVVLENIYRRRSMGESAAKASVLGASEVNLAIILATLTTIAVFVPMLLIDDEAGFFKFYMQRIGLPVIFALLASLFVALVLIPLATSRFSTDQLAEENRLIVSTKRIYQTLLRRALNHRIDMVIIVIAVIVVNFGVIAPLIPQSDDQGGNISDLMLIFDFPGNISSEEVEDYFGQVEDTIFAHSQSYGLKATESGFNDSFGRIRVYLKSRDDNQWYHTIYRGMLTLIGADDNYPMPKGEVLADLKERIPDKPGVEFRTSWRGGSDTEGAITINLFGDDTARLAELAEEVERRMRLLDGVISVETDRESGADEIRISMDREAVTRSGISPDQVAYTLMYAVRGLELPRFQADDKEIDVRIQLKEEDRENLEQLKNMTFATNRGTTLPLSAIADFSFERGFGEISREDGKTYLAVKVQTTATDLPKISGQIDELMADFTMPYGYNWQKGARFQNFEQQGAAFVNAMLIAIIFVYLLMAILFESPVYPLSILLTIPLAFFGGNLMLLITNTPQDTMAGIGLIILVGVIVNNGIVLIDMVNRRRQEGLSRSEAIMDAGMNRFRPIMMTSFTTIGGLIPMALGSANLIGTPYAPMGRIIIGGMLTGTFLTLVVVPVFYTLFDDMVIYFSRVRSWLMGSSRLRRAAGGLTSTGILGGLPEDGRDD